MRPTHGCTAGTIGKRSENCLDIELFYEDGIGQVDRVPIKWHSDLEEYVS